MKKLLLVLAALSLVLAGCQKAEESGDAGAGTTTDTPAATTPADAGTTTP